MTKEEAIRILEYPVSKWSMDWDERDDGLSYYDAIQLAVSALRNQLESNAPLALEELREMDGEPVWLQSQGLAHYDILTGFTTSGVTQFYTAALPSENYGKTWLAYRRKPEVLP